MAIPTIAMIPSSFKAGELGSILPLDVNGDFDGDGDFTITRASSATRVNQIGLIEEVAANVPRLDYTGGGCPSLLLEPQSTNLAPYSEDFSNAIYVKDSGVSIGTTNNLSPKGNLSATKINVTNNGRIYLNANSTTYVPSIFIKAGVFSYFKFNSTEVDLVLKTINNGTIEEFKNGWFRISVSYTGNRPFQIQSYPNSSYSSHTTNGDYYIWGTQLEEQSYATSYIPTTGASSTRIADAATLDLTPFTLTSITETIGGVEQTPITAIPSTYTIPFGKINKIIMI